jgi:hypothetical protein
MKTPRSYTFNLAAAGAAGDRAEIKDYGRYLRILTITDATTINISIDNDPEGTVPTGSWDFEDTHYTFIRLRNTTAGAIAVTVLVCEVKPFDIQSDTLLSIAALLAALATLHTDLATTIHTDLGTTLHDDVKVLSPAKIAGSPVTVALTGGAATHLIAAAAATREITVQCPQGNLGNVYFDYVNTVSDASYAFYLVAGGARTIRTAADLYAVSDNGTEEVCGDIAT